MTSATATRPPTARRRSSSFTSLRTGVMVATSSGIALTMAAPVAMAAPAEPSPVEADTAGAQTLLAEVSPTVAVPADAQWTIETTDVRIERPVTREETARQAPVGSRSTAREALGTAADPAPVASASAAAVLDIARRYVGVPYVYGGTTPAGFDCSGYTQYVFAQLGVSLPRSSSDQRYAGTVVSAADAQPGDLVWWPGHIGIYTGNGQHIAARQPGTPLQEGPIYGSNPVFIRVL